MRATRVIVGIFDVLVGLLLFAGSVLVFVVDSAMKQSDLTWVIGVLYGIIFLTGGIL